VIRPRQRSWGRGRWPSDSQNDSVSAIACYKLFSKVASQCFSRLRSLELANVQGFAFSLRIRIPSIKRNPTSTRRGISDYCHSHTLPYRCAEASRCCHTSSTLYSHVVFQTGASRLQGFAARNIGRCAGFCRLSGDWISSCFLGSRSFRGALRPKPLVRAWKAGADRSQQADG
jgi:hypothetical protein